MAVETATKIQDLNTAWPTGTDAVSEGDDHIRLIKTVLVNSLSSVGQVLQIQVTPMTEGPFWSSGSEVYSGRWELSWTTIGNSISFTPVSATSKIIIETSGWGGVSGQGARHNLKMRAVTTDEGDAIGGEHVIVGYNIDFAEPGFKTLELESSFNNRSLMDSTGLSEFSFNMQGFDGGGYPDYAAGCVVGQLVVLVTEIQQ